MRSLCWPLPSKYGARLILLEIAQFGHEMPDPLFDIRLRWRGVRAQTMDAGASRAPTDNGLLAPEFGRRPRAREERAKSIGVRSLKQAPVLSNAPDITTTTACATAASSPCSPAVRCAGPRWRRQQPVFVAGLTAVGSN